MINYGDLSEKGCSRTSHWIKLKGEVIIKALHVAVLQWHDVYMISIKSCLFHHLSECRSLSSCPEAGTLLNMPVLDSCLPPSLSQVTWVLNVPEQGSVELSSPQGSLHQSVPGVQGCDGLQSVLVSAANGVNVGRFCSASKGIIQKVQISSNITVTATADEDKDLRLEKAPILNVSFSSEITGRLELTDHLVWF